MGTNNLTQIGIVTTSEATGDDVDQYLTALGADFVPRNASGVVTDQAGAIGTAAFKWSGAEFQDTTNVKFGGTSLASLLEGNVIDNICTDEVLSNDFSLTTTILNTFFTKNAQDKFLRITLTGGSAGGTGTTTISVGAAANSIVRSYTQFMSSSALELKHDWYDIRSLAAGVQSIAITTNSIATGTCKIFRNAF